MEQKRIKYRLLPGSSAPGITAVLLLVATALVCVVYWPVFLKFAQKPALADSQLKMMLYIYGGLAACFLLAALFTGVLGKKTMLFTALFITPICLYYIAEKLGVFQWLIFGNKAGLAGVYTDNAAYYSGRNLAYIITAAVFALLTLICFWSIIFNKGRSRTFAMFIIIVAAVARILFALYDIRVNWQPLLDSKAISGTDYTYAVLMQVASVLFFLTMAVLAIELRRHFIEAEQPQTAPAAPAAPVAPVAPAAPVEEPKAEPSPAKPAEEPKPEEAPAVEAEPVAAEDVPKPAKKRGRKPKAEAVEVAEEAANAPDEA